MSKEISNITEEMNSKIWKIQKTEDYSEFIIRKEKFLIIKLKIIIRNHLHFNKKIRFQFF